MTSEKVTNRQKNFALLRNINGVGVITIYSKLFSESTESNIALGKRELSTSEARHIEQSFDLPIGWFDLDNKTLWNRLFQCDNSTIEIDDLLNGLKGSSKHLLIDFLKSLKG